MLVIVVVVVVVVAAAVGGGGGVMVVDDVVVVVDVEVCNVVVCGIVSRCEMYGNGKHFVSYIFYRLLLEIKRYGKFDRFMFIDLGTRSILCWRQWINFFGPW